MGSIDIKWVKESVIDGIKSKITELPQRGQDLVIDVLNVFMLISQVLAPSLTGALRNSIQVYLGTLSGEVTSFLDYFRYVLLGTEEHSIGSPVWIPQAVGWRYIGLSPLGRGKPHPGTKPNDFMADTYGEAMPEAEVRMDNFLEWLRS